MEFMEYPLIIIHYGWAIPRLTCLPFISFVTSGNEFPLACRFEARKLTQTQKMAVSDAHCQKYPSKPHPSGRIIKHTSQQKSNRQLLDSPSLPTHRIHGFMVSFAGVDMD